MGNNTNRRGRSRGRRGISFLEVMISIAVLTIGLAGFLQSLVSANRLEGSVSDQSAACAAARATVENLRATAFAETFARYNASADDDPPGGASPGPRFDVAGLRPLPGQASVGTIRFPVAAGNPLVLREDLVDAELGTPLDLNADGALTAADRAADYRLLPVVVSVRWQSASGPNNFELRTILGAAR